MIALRWLAATVLFLVFSQGVAAAEPARTVGGVALQSSKDLDIAALNERIAAAQASGTGSMTSPIPLVLELVGGTAETPRVSLETISSDAEDFNRVSVTITRDGFLDDSVRGDWHEFTLARDAAGAWTVVEGKMAVRCWRGGVDVYADRLCP